MEVTTIRPLTRRDYESLPETGRRYQLIGGRLLMAPAPNRYHQEISKNLEFVLHGHVKSNGLGKIYDAPFDVVFSEYDVYQPDIIFVSNERRHILTKQGAEGAPDLVVEILSPRSAKYDRNSKLSTYAQTGVIEYWLIDPDEKTIEVFLFKENPEKPVRILRLGEDERFGSELLPGLAISLEEIFAYD